MTTMFQLPRILNQHLRPSFHLRKKGKKAKDIQSRSEEELEEIFDSDLEVIEAFLARKYSRGRGKYKGKVP